MFGGCDASNCRPCNVADSKTDTVKVNFAGLDGKENAKAAPPASIAMDQKAAAARQAQLAAEEEQERERQRVAALFKAQEEERLRRARAEEEAAQERRRQQEEEARLARQRAEEAARAARAESLRKEREAQEEAERRRREAEKEAERLRQEKEKADAAKVGSFLTANGFAQINAKKKSMMSSQYPLHVAVKQNNPEVVQLLIEARADACMKNSSGQTPLDKAKKSDKKGSHAAVLDILQNANVSAMPTSPAI